MLIVLDVNIFSWDVTFVWDKVLKVFELVLVISNSSLGRVAFQNKIGIGFALLHSTPHPGKFSIAIPFMSKYMFHVNWTHFWNKQIVVLKEHPA